MPREAKAGGCDSAYLEAIARLTSLALRSGIDPDQIVEQLQGITCDPAWDGGTLVRSAPDAVSLALGRHLHQGGPREISPEQEASADSVAQLGLFPSNQETKSRANGHQLPSGARCPECSGYLIHQEGCLSCLDCGYNKCE